MTTKSSVERARLRPQKGEIIHSQADCLHMLCSYATQHAHREQEPHIISSSPSVRVVSRHDKVQRAMFDDEGLALVSLYRRRDVEFEEVSMAMLLLRLAQPQEPDCRCCQRP